MARPPIGIAKLPNPVTRRRSTISPIFTSTTKAFHKMTRLLSSGSRRLLRRDTRERASCSGRCMLPAVAWRKIYSPRTFGSRRPRYRGTLEETPRFTLWSGNSLPLNLRKPNLGCDLLFLRPGSLATSPRCTEAEGAEQGMAPDSAGSGADRAEPAILNLLAACWPGREHFHTGPGFRSRWSTGADRADSPRYEECEGTEKIEKESFQQK